MAYTERFTEVNRLGSGFFPATYVAGQYLTAWNDMSHNQRGVFVLGVGNMDAGAVLDCLLLEATDATGANAQVIEDKEISQLQQGAGDGNDSIAIEFRTEELDVNAGYSFVAALVVVQVDDVDLAGSFFLTASNNVPVPVAVWTEIVD